MGSPKKQASLTLPLLPLRDVVVYPHMVIPLFVGRTESIKALDIVMDDDKQIFLLAQRDANIEMPEEGTLYEVGVVATVLQLLRLPDGTTKVLVEGIHRARRKKIIHEDGYLAAEIEAFDEYDEDPKVKKEFVPAEVDATIRRVHSLFEEYVKLNNKIPTEVLVTVGNIIEPGKLADVIAAHLSAKIELRQQFLEAGLVAIRMDILHGFLQEEIDSVEVDKKIQGRVKKQVETSQRQYYLSEKMKAIQKEMGDLGESTGVPMDDMQKLEKAIDDANMSADALEKAKSEFTKLKMMPQMSAEATVCRNYIEWLINVPWANKTDIKHSLSEAEATLEEDHYGLEKVKERILEYLAVQQRVEKLKGPILCLVGPPGVGKTSLGQSIANATGRHFARISLGGVRDEAEIRGHRRTYIGALPGKIIQRMAKAKVRNPLFMLDEVDKMAMDFRGDPASALLEVLDPEQNNTFNDHFLEVDYDLSDVMFIATANSMNIPAPLLDRMEVIRIAGYTEDEKLNIATRYLVKRQIKQNGLKKSEIGFSDSAIMDIIRYYTREAGVRNLERELAKICRKIVKDILLKKIKKSKKVTAKNLEDYLGVRKFRFGLAEEKDQVGQVTGLAWTEVGGELLTIEAQLVPGKGKTAFTGSLGEVMTESIQAAMTVVRSRARTLGIEDKLFQDHDFHVHVPEGATPKDGPSAGGAMCTAIVSALTRIPVRADVAMTGEITLRGEVLPIGGLKEKLLAALRGGIKEVIIPKDNEPELKELPENITRDLIIHPVKWVDQVLDIALTAHPKPLETDDVAVPAAATVKKSKSGSRKRARQ